jgi:hypothetical protein
LPANPVNCIIGRQVKKIKNFNCSGGEDYSGVVSVFFRKLRPIPVKTKKSSAKLVKK